MDTQVTSASHAGHEVGHLLGFCLKRKFQTENRTNAFDCSFSCVDEKRQRVTIEENPRPESDNLTTTLTTLPTETKVQWSSEPFHNDQENRFDVCLANHEDSGDDVGMETQTTDVNMETGSQSVEGSSEASTTNDTPAENVGAGIAEDYIRSHRPDHLQYCVPTLCHPGGLWDVMLEVYHGL